MVERWVRFYGGEGARQICGHGQVAPAQILRLSDPMVESELGLAGVVTKPGKLLSSARQVVSGEAMATPAFREGRVRMQDEGSQLVAEIAAVSCSGARILDACAAPGGKTLILAERNRQAQIVACESSAPRFEQLRQRLSPIGQRIECRLADATELNEDGTFDLVLADVPCSGTGTLGRNPEIRHRLRLEDLARQAERQRAILAAALRAIRPGGRAIYSTCSLEPEENEEVVASVLEATPNVRRVSIREPIHDMVARGVLMPVAEERIQAAVTGEGALRLLPGAFGTDGFFIASMERIA
jgi:16S rRNA (cytosine967-C5)-methyltransferase